MKVENDAILTCSVCLIEGPHRLLYLSRHLCASECINCGATNTYSGHIYAEYAKDLTERVARLPLRLAGEVTRSPTAMLLWPGKALLKPLGLANEINQVTTFERRSRRRHRV